VKQVVKDHLDQLDYLASKELMESEDHLAIEAHQEHKECPDWKVPKAPQEQMVLPDSLVLLDQMAPLETEALLACLDQQDLWERVDPKDHREREEILDFKEKKDHRDPLDCRALLGLWVQEEKEVKKEVLASLDLQDWVGAQVTRAHLVLLVAWDHQEHLDCLDHQEKLDHQGQQEKGVSVELWVLQVLLALLV
jgi:hypothetical protein